MISTKSPTQDKRLQVVEICRDDPLKLQVLAKAAESDDKSEEATIKIVLEGVWTQARIVKHMIIHLIDPLFDSATNVYHVNNSNGLLVTEPDNLLTCTLVASTLFCERKTWLNHVFSGQVGTNRAMLVGTLVHEVFQYGVKNKINNPEKLIKYLDDLMDDATVMLEIYSVEMHMKDIRKEAISYIDSVREWIEKYMLVGPRYPLTNDSEIEVKIVGISDIEENIWSTKYGLKGKIDVTGSVRVYDKRTKSLTDKTLPLELKTGNPNLSSSHAAQVSLYSMMIEDRYALTNQGLVIYLKDKAAMHNVTLTHGIKRDLVQRRNQINYHMKSYFFGPDMIDQPRLCKNCERLTECILTSKLYVPNELSKFPSMKSLESEATGHLDDRFISFFKKHHERLAALMTNTDITRMTDGSTSEGANKNQNGSFWTYSSEEAEAKGTGFGRLQASLPDGKSEANRIIFRRHPDYAKNFESSTTHKLAPTTPITKKARIDDYFKPKKVDGDQPKARPFNTELNFSRCRIAISLDSENTDMKSRNSSTAIAIGFMQDFKEDHFVLKLYEGALESIKPNLMYRVDKIEKRAANLDIERLILVRLLAREDWRTDRVRQLLLDPKFEPQENIDMNLFVLSSAFEEITELDGDYQKPIVEAISTDNYYILNEKNLPDSPKINRIIGVLTRVICSLNRTVLIVAQNIDNLMDLMRLIQKKVRFILIDDGKSTQARFQYSSNLVKVPQDANKDLLAKYDSYIKQHENAPVVVTTYAMSVGGLLFTRRTFDYCIAYNCDSTELLTALAPMFCSDRHIMIDIRKRGTGTTLTNGSKSSETANVSLGDHLRQLRMSTPITID